MITYLGCSYCLVHSGCKIARFQFDRILEKGTEFNLSHDDDLHRDVLDVEYTRALEGWVNGKDVYMKFRPYKEDRLFLLEAYLDDHEGEEDD